MSLWSDALLKETAAKVKSLEERFAVLEKPASDPFEEIKKLKGEIQALKMRMGKKNGSE